VTYVEPYQPDVLAARYELPGAAMDRLSTLVAALTGVRNNARPKVADALTGLELEEVRNASRMADLGTGMHCPGLVLAAVLPDTEVTLVEKNPLRCLFLERTARSMRLANVEVVEGSVLDWTEGRATCDLVTSRAAAPVPTLLEWAAPLLVPGGSFVAWVGPEHADDVAPAAADAAAALGLRRTAVHRTTIVDSRERDLHVFEKTGAAGTAAGTDVEPRTDAAIAVASLALEWQAGLDQAEREELALLADRLGAHRFLRESRRLMRELRRRGR